jgi:ribosome biogenesis protein UTP30
MPKRGKALSSLNGTESADHVVEADAALSGLNDETVVQAVRSLLTHVKVAGLSSPETFDEGEAELEGDAEIISVVVVLKCPPKRACLKPRLIPLAHPLYRAGADDVCLFVKDPQRLVKDHLAERNVEGISKVMGVSKLEKRYGTHEGRRELSQLYDLFLVDDRVLPMMPRLLGNAFVRSKKMPMIIRMDRDIPKSIEKALHSTTFCPGSGTTCTIRVAKTTFLPEQIAENVQTAVAQLAATFHNAMSAFQALYIKSERSPSLPIFFSMPTSQDFAISAEEKAAIAAAHRKKITKHKKRLRLKAASPVKRRSRNASVGNRRQSASLPDVGVDAVKDPKSKRPNGLTASRKVNAENTPDSGGISRSVTDTVETAIVTDSTAKSWITARSSDSRQDDEVNVVSAVGSKVGEKRDGQEMRQRPGGASKKLRTSDRPLVRKVVTKKAHRVQDKAVSTSQHARC